MTHPYEAMFSLLRDKRGLAWRTNNGAVHDDQYRAPLVAAIGAADDEYIDDDALACIGMTWEQVDYVMLATYGCAYPGCGYEDLARKLYHYLGVKHES